MERIKGTGWSILLYLCLCVSCTLVKEDRTYCPCTLFVSLGALPEEPVEIRVLADELCYRNEVDRDTTVLVQVPKRKALVTGISGGRWTNEGYVNIPEGEDCPAVFMARHPVETDRDTVHCRVRLHKHFCTLGLRFDGPPGWGEPFSVRIRGRVAGLFPDGSPVEGPFSCTLVPEGTCRLPRQAPGEELWLDITLPEGVLRSFALGTYLEQAGFDWTAPDLKDASLRIDLSVTAIRFTIGLWSTTIPIKVVI